MVILLSQMANTVPPPATAEQAAPEVDVQPVLQVLVGHVKVVTCPLAHWVY
jgi:hypothetical protein